MLMEAIANKNQVHNLQQTKQGFKPQIQQRKQKNPQQPPVKYKSFKYLTFLTLTYCLGSFYFGYMLAYISSIAFATIRQTFHVDWQLSLSQGLIIGAIPVGALIGSATSHFLVVRFSRRKIIIWTDVFALVMGGILFIQDQYVLLLARYGQGFCLGIYSALTPVIIHQLAPLQIAGRLGSYHQLMVFIGTFVAFLLKYICELIADDLPGKRIWYYVFGFPLITVSLQLLLLLFKFKFSTPKYYVQKHKHLACYKVLRKIYKPEYVQGVYLHILQDLGMKIQDIPREHRFGVIDGVSIDLKTKPGLESFKIQKKKEEQNIIDQNQLIPAQTETRIINQDIQQNKEEDNNENIDDQKEESQLSEYSQQKSLQTPKVAKFLALFIALLQRFSGINAIVAYSAQVVGKVMPEMVSIFPIIINALPVITNFIASFIFKKYGRKVFLQLGAAIAFVATGIVAIGFFISWDHNTTVGTVLIYTGQILYMMNFGFALGPVVWVYLSQIAMESFVPYAVAVNWVGCSIVMILFPIIKAALPNQNPAPLFLFFCAWSMLQFIVNGKFAIQTKGKNYKQIYNQFTNFKTQGEKKMEAQKKQKQLKQSENIQANEINRSKQLPNNKIEPLQIEHVKHN